MEFKTSYKEKSVIGRGNFGVATLVVEKATGKEYVAKKINMGNLSEYELKGCQLEARLLQTLDHPNIVQYKDTFVDPGQLIIVMEYCRGGDLSQLIKVHKQSCSFFPESQICEWMTQLLSALKYLDGLRIIHRDIKSSNVYLTESGSLKLGDFGIAKVLSCTADVAKTVVGTPYYMSPEVCESKPYTSKSDIWSLGCLFYEMTALKHPFGGTSFLALVMSILKDSPQMLPSSYSQELTSIITSMLTKDMKLRPSAQTILKLEYFVEKENLQTENYSDEYNNELDYEVSDSSSNKSDEVMYGSRSDNLGISGINPLELVNTQLYESVSTVTEYELSTTIPTFTPDIQVTGTNFFQSTKKQESIKASCTGNEEDEYEDDFESESSSDQPYDDDFDECQEEDKQNAIKILGVDNFQKIWEYLKVHRKQDTPEEVRHKQILKELAKLVGKKAANNYRIVDELFSQNNKFC